MNTVNIIGNITKDIELRYTPNGTAVVTLSIAVNERRGEEDYASFFDVIVFGKQAENCNQYLSKGKKVGVTGRLRQERWEKDGAKRSKVVIIAERVEFLTPKQGNYEFSA